MNSYIIFAIGVVAGMIIVQMITKKNKLPPVLSERQVKERAEHREKIMAYFNTAEGKRVTNDDIQKLLDVSDSTATRYLEEIEKDGLIRQVGDTGSGVFYEKI
jgi:Fic family protein